MTTPEVEKLLEDTAQKLGEHFDAVQLMVTWVEDGMTCCVKRGNGNFYARQGMAQDFINSDVAQENARPIIEALKEKPDDSDDWKSV